MIRKTSLGIFSLAALALIIFCGTHFISTRIYHQPVSSIDGDTDENEQSQRTYAAEVSNALRAPKVTYAITSSTPQFIVFSFDGSKSIPMLDETLDFQQKMMSENRPLHFTYFINAAYFLTKENSQFYQAPGQVSGTSQIGFSSSTNDISLRVHEFNKAFTLGNEIGSHSAGHFDGSGWSYDEWRQEFSSFMSVLTNVQRNNSSAPIDAPLFLSNIHGFRAPNLGVNDNLYKVLGENMFSYDASGVNATDAWPEKDIYGVWHIPLGTVYLGTDKRPVISMDYSIWTRQSTDKEEAVKGTPLWNQYYNDIETAYMNYFNTNYNENRSPIVIADHFSKWNDGVYWEALKAFAENVCGKPNIQCVTFKDVVNYLNTTGTPAKM